MNTVHLSDVQFVLSDEIRESLTVRQGFEAVKTKVINRNVDQGGQTALTEIIFADIDSAGLTSHDLTGKMVADLAQRSANVLREDAASGGKFASDQNEVFKCEAAISSERSRERANPSNAKAVAIRKASEAPVEPERVNAAGGAPILTVRLETLKDQAAAFRSCEQAVGAHGFKLQPVANH